MVSAIRQSPRYRCGLAFVAWVGGQIVGFGMLRRTDLIDGDGTCRDVPTLTPLDYPPAIAALSD
jgi:predicted N-acetyltransferase YhbS